MIYHPLSSSRIAAMSLGFMLAGITSGSSAIFVQELFDGIAGNPGVDSSINGKGNTSTTIGLAGTWATNANTGIFVASNFNTGAGLPGLPSNGGTNGGVWNNTGGNYGPGIYATRPLATTIDFAVDQTIYFSVLVNNSGDTSMGIGLASGANGSAEFIGGGLTWNNATTIGTGVAAGNAAYVGYGTLDTANGPYGIRANEAAGSINGAALLVGRITISSTMADVIDLKRYGAGSTIEASPASVAWTTSTSVDSSMVASNLLLWLNGNSGTNAGEVDAIRFGNTWSDVTGVPEPASPLLGAIGLALVTCRRHRRR